VGVRGAIGIPRGYPFRQLKPLRWTVTPLAQARSWRVPSAVGVRCQIGMQPNLLHDDGAVAVKVELTVGTIGIPALPDEEAAEVVVGRAEPDRGLGELVGSKRVDHRVEEAGPVADGAVSWVDDELDNLSVGGRARVLVSSRSCRRESPERCPFERNEYPLASFLGLGDRPSPLLGERIGWQVIEHIGGQQRSIRLLPGPNLHLTDRGRIIGPRNANADIGGGLVHPPILSG
jgi:hypothetical protein